MEPKKKNKKISIQNSLIIRPPQRSPQDISKWRSAMQQADRGRLYALVELYNDLRIDAVLGNAVEKRIMAITNSELLFSKDNKEVEEITDLIDTTDFEELLSEMILAKFYPKTVLELDFSEGFKVVSIDRRHLNTESKSIVRNVSDTEGIPYENDDFLIHLGKEGDLGIFLRTAPYAIFKRNGMSDFAQYAELFGIDTLVGYYDGEDENGRQEMETAFRNRGSAASMTMNKNNKVDTIGTKGNGRVDIHDRLLAKCDEQILISVLGQTMTTKDGSSYSQGKVHAQTEDDINLADRRYVQRILNKELLPRLEKRGYPVSGGYFHFAEKGERLSKKDELDIALKVNEIAPVDETYWYDNFGLPKPQGAIKKDEDTPETEQKKPRGKQKVKAKDLSAIKKFLNFFANAPR